MVSCDFNSLTKSVTMIFIRSELAHAHSYSLFAHAHHYDVVGAFQMGISPEVGGDGPGASYPHQDSYHWL